MLDDLQQPGVLHFLRDLGYTYHMTIQERLAVLSEHLTDCDLFPHEIGIFLGYPLHDVVGFIRHKGSDYCVSGLWKVYKHPKKALKSFHQFKECTTIYKQLYQDGRTILQILAVA